MKAAQDFFFRTEGLPYGFHNFLFGWIDVPYLSPIVPKGGFMPVFGIFEGFMPWVSEIFFSQSLNKRLGTKGLTVGGLAIEAGKRNISASQLMAMQE